MKLNRIFIIVKKELLDIIRDKRTVIVSIFIPIVFIPIVSFFLTVNIKKNIFNEKNKITVSTNIKRNIFINLKKFPIEFIYTKDPLKNLSDKKSHLAFIKKNKKLFLYIDKNSQASFTSSNVFLKFFETYKNAVYKSALSSLKIKLNDIYLNDINVEYLNPLKSNNFLLSLLIPLFVLIFSSVAPMPTAADLGAGEKERGTLEPLLSTSVSKIEILMGKFFTTFLMGLLGVISFFTGLFISYVFIPEIFNNIITGFNINLSAILVIIIITMLLIMLFASFELFLSFFSKSSKEAQVFSLPLLILSMAAGYSIFIIDSRSITLSYYFIPLVNSGLLIKELINGNLFFYKIFIVFFQMIFYITMSLFASFKILCNEKIIYNN